MEGTLGATRYGKENYENNITSGIGSRFGTGIKQLEPVDDAGHIIMDYSIDCCTIILIPVSLK